MSETGAFVFDMDGTMVDNIPFHIRSWLALLSELGVQITRDEFVRRMMGKTNAETLRELVAPEILGDRIAEYAARKEAMYRELYRPHLKLVAGLAEFLRDARDLGVPMAVATSAPPANVEFVLGGLEIEAYFQAVVGADQVQRGKPHPDIFLVTAERLGVVPARCLVFEDAPMGIEAARRAGIRAVAVTTSLDAREFAGAPGVVRVIPDFVSVSPAMLLGL